MKKLFLLSFLFLGMCMANANDKEEIINVNALPENAQLFLNNTFQIGRAHV